MKALLRELRVRWPVGRHECYECPGALFLRWPSFYRQHDFQPTDGRRTVIGMLGLSETVYIERCRACGKEIQINSSLHLLRYITADTEARMAAFLGGGIVASDGEKLLFYSRPDKIEWLEDDLWQHRATKSDAESDESQSQTP